MQSPLSPKEPKNLQQLVSIMRQRKLRMMKKIWILCAIDILSENNRADERKI